jgi:plastocyanin
MSVAEVEAMKAAVTRRGNAMISLYKQSRRAPLLITVCGALLLLVWASPLSAGTITGKVVPKKAKYRANAVVYIDSIPGKTFEPPDAPVLIDQKGLKFHPHVLPILSGTTVEFLNSDEVLHNVFTPDKVGDKFNLGSWPKGEKKSHTFSTSCEKACEAVMLCNVHPEMEAYVVILNNPYFAVTDEEGQFVIENVPAGEYTLHTWHERLKESTQKITVGASDTVAVEIPLKK